jgi:AraC family transcriptional regulator, regulatory protein of adaptative response / DNA-3-methyladenine glycosylase II
VEPGGPDHALATIRFPTLAALPRLIARIRRVFDLAADPTIIGAHLSEDPRLAPLVARRPGLRTPGAWDGFELGVRAILGQQITVVAARRLAGELTGRYGERVDTPWAEAEGLTHVFPTAAAIAAADLSHLPMPRARSRAIGSLAAALVADPRLFEPARSLDEAVARLRGLDGIGEWTAQYIAMRELREPDAFPDGDVALQKAMADPSGVRPTAKQLRAAAEAWRPWRAYAALHLWASLAPQDGVESNDRFAA